MAPHKYIQRETAVSIAINVAISAGIFMLAFGTDGPVTVWGFGGYWYDFAPQGFMIGLMSTLIPGALARKAVIAGRLDPLAGSTRWPSGLMIRSFLFGFLSAACALLVAAVLLDWLALPSISWRSALAAKLLAGAILAASFTPLGIVAELKSAKIVRKDFL